MTRTSSEVGAGLAPARPARAILAGERIHVLGIAGAGASGAAILAHAAGAIVSGCDPGGPSPYTPPLAAIGVAIAPGHDPSHVTRRPRPDRLAVTKALTAIDADHPELAAARLAGIPVEPWQQVVADAAADRTLVAVAGTHGKSTSAGWLTHVLVETGHDPSAFVGALLPASVTAGLPATARVGTGRAFVVEADEYAGNFDAYRPDVALVTSAEWDHPDVFADRGAVIDAFERWLRTAARSTVDAPETAPASPVPVLLANVADSGVSELVARLGDQWGRVVSIALVDERVGAPGVPPGLERGSGKGIDVVGRIVAADANGTTLTIDAPGMASGTMTTRLASAGRHNASNALGVAATALVLGVEPEGLVSALGSFPGVGRRLERKGEAGGVLVFDDYAHHPTAIAETIRAVRQRAPDRRLWAVYEPLTFHRTRALLEQFAAALAAADRVAIADIWAGRDTDEDRASVTAADLAAATDRQRPGVEARATGSPEASADRLAAVVRPGDVVLVMGGGRSYRIGELLLEQLGR